MLEVIIRVEEREVPEPVALHQRAPLRRVGGIDVVVLAEPVQRERDRKDEEYGDDTGTDGNGCAEEIPQQREGRQVEPHRQPALTPDGALQIRRIRGGFEARSAEVDREQRGRRIEQLQPARIDLRRQVGALGVVLVGSELGVVIQVPARELARRNAARRRVEQRQRALRRRARPLEDGVVHDLVQHHGEVEDGEALHQGERHPHQRVAVVNQAPGAGAEQRELAEGDCQMPRRGLAVEIAQQLAGNGLPELGLEPDRMLRKMMMLHEPGVSVPEQSGTGYAVGFAPDLTSLR